MTNWGSVLSIEAQERVYYALAGNIAINNCFNAIAIHGAVSSESGVLQIPSPDYFVPSSFGSLELRQRSGNEFIGQPIDYEKTVSVRKLALDEFNLPRVDLIKIDVEGMEMEALEGANRTIAQSRPIMLIEKIKADAVKLRHWLAGHGYEILEVGINMLAIHKSDKTLTEIQREPAAAQPAA
jgi:FkbM family methyltransferase